MSTTSAGAAPLTPRSATRLDEALTFDSGEAVAVLYGPSATDLFCCADLHLRAIDAAILHRLKAAGYQQVVFCTLDGFYYLDAESEAAGEAQRGGSVDGGKAPAAAPLGRFKGPLGTQDALPRRGPPARPARSVPDTFKVKTMHALMMNRLARTAVVILKAEDFLNHITAPRELADRVGEWFTHGTSSGNLAVLVFTNSTLDEVIAAVERTNTQGTLLAFLRGQLGGRDTRNIGRIRRPDEQELAGLIHRTRLREGMTLADWTELPRIASSMAGRDDSLKRWHSLLTGIGAEQPISAQLLRTLVPLDASTADGRSAWERLDELMGLQTVKDHIRVLAAQAKSRRSRPRTSKRSNEPPSMHLVFTGNPGTGKTTVARLIAEIYRDIGLIRFNKLHAVKVTDLVGQYVGHTAHLTNAAIDAAMGGVLFIDEAYRLSATDRGGFGQEAIDELVGRLEDDRHKFVTIVAGYPEQMEEFIGSNPGLHTRFETTVHFPDYEPSELLDIALGGLESEDLTWDEEFVGALTTAVETIYRERDPSNFGNAREMRKLVNEIDRNWSNRVGAAYTEPLSGHDIPERYRDERPAAGCWERLDELTGLGPVKKHLRRLARQVESQRLRPVRSGRTPEPGSPHLIFSGNPGTGKTTVARLMAEAYHDIGVIRSSKLRSVEASNLIGGYVGHTAIRTNAEVDAALGGVLFIDEAYRLSAPDRGGFGQEAIDTLVTRLEDNRDEFVVIAAGYPASMEEFRNSNPGLPGRFPKRNIVHFPDYAPNELLTIVTHMLEGRSLVWDDEFATALGHAVDRLYRDRDLATFGNAREMRELADDIDQSWSNRVGLSFSEPVTALDIPTELQEHGL